MAKEIHPITVDLPVALWEALSKMAKADGRKVAWMARWIIEQAVEKNKKGGE